MRDESTVERMTVLANPGPWPRRVEILDVRADEVDVGDWVADGLRVVQVVHHRIVIDVVACKLDDIPMPSTGVGEIRWVELSFEQTPTPQTYPLSAPIRVMRGRAL
jgi:hypothetical protein